MKLLLFTDAWFPQVNGVVRTLNMVANALKDAGDDVKVVSPADFKTVPCPSYPEIRLALGAGKTIKKILKTETYDAIHIATEGPIGLAARNACKKQSRAFTTAYHTKFPEYVNVRSSIPLTWVYAAIRWFHAASSGVMVATPTLYNELENRGFMKLRQWSRGVDLAQFKPYPKDCIPEFSGLKRPILTYVGRVSVEKNIAAFLELETRGTKVVVGAGPQLTDLQKRFPETVFVGSKTGCDLAKHYAASDVFVFPSKTDTFGLVMLEALASGVPVAAYPVAGPLDVIGLGGTGVLQAYTKPIGCLDDDLAVAITAALDCDEADCRAYANEFSWSNCAELFRNHLILWRDTGGEPQAVKASAAA